MKLRATSEDKRGFSLPEILITVAILLILAAVSVPLYGNFQAHGTLEAASARLLQDVRIAQSRAVAGEGDAAAGVHFEADRYVLFRGNDFGENPSFDEEVVLDESLALTKTFTADDVVFSRGRGLPSATGTIMLFDAVGTNTREILINEIGGVEKK